MNAPAEPSVQLFLPLGSVNFIIESLNQNPLRAPVMQVAALITLITDQAQAPAEVDTIGVGGTD